jgi:3-oxoacyl-[acyl-carrier protein] reductase
MSRSLARELGSRNITVNCVAPGFIATDMTHALDRKQKEAMLASIPLGRAGTPEDIAGAVSFLVSPAACLCHRYNSACEWRHVHGLISTSLGFW